MGTNRASGCALPSHIAVSGDKSRDLSSVTGLGQRGERLDLGNRRGCRELA
jgi:hypothetical protein